MGGREPGGSAGNPIDIDKWAAENPEGECRDPIDIDKWAAENPEGSAGNPIDLDKVSVPPQPGSLGAVARVPTHRPLKEVWKSIQRTGTEYPQRLRMVFLAWARCETGDEATRNAAGKGGSTALNNNMMNAEGNMGEAPPGHVAAPTSGVTDPESARKRYDPKLNGPLSDWHPELKVPMSYTYEDPGTKEKWDARTIDGQLATMSGAMKPPDRRRVQQPAVTRLSRRGQRRFVRNPMVWPNGCQGAERICRAEGPRREGVGGRSRLGGEDHL